MTFQWNDAYACGHAPVDEARKALLQACQELVATDDWIALRPLILALYKCMKRLFELEEALLRQHAAPDLVAHSQQHADFLERLADRSTDVGKGHMNKKAIVRVMTEWLELHQLQFDVALRNWPATAQS